MSQPSSERPTGREYLRVSRDRSGRQRSVTEQHDDNEHAAGARGVTLLDPYAEPKAISASRYGRKPRGSFAKLVADLRSGRFGADELWLWESSRGSRKVSEWVELVEALEAARVKVYVTTHSRLYDPANPRDRRSLLEDAVDSEYETGKLSQRSRRAHAATAAAGKPAGPVGYGWARVYDPVTRESRQTLNEVEAAVVREMYQRIAAGHSLRSIARDLADRDVRTHRGYLWTIQTMRNLLLRESNKGVRVHRPRDGGPVTRHKASWPPIVDPVLWQRVYDILTAPERRTRRAARATHLLSMFTYCDVCGEVLMTRMGKNTGMVYRCLPGCVAVQKGDLDELAVEAIVAYLTREDVAAQLAAAAGSTPDLDAARVELSDAERDLDELYAEGAAGRVSAAGVARMEPGILARVEAARAKMARLSASPRLAGLIQPGPDARQRWAELPLEARREVARVLLSPDVLGELRVTPGVRGRRIPVAERVVWRRESK